MAEDGARKRARMERPGGNFTPEIVVDVSSDRDVDVKQEPRAPPSQDGEHFKVWHILLSRLRDTF